MTEDIVDVLRGWDDQRPPFRTMLEAAEEIERLRAAGDALVDAMRRGSDSGWDDAVDAWVGIRGLHA